VVQQAAPLVVCALGIDAGGESARYCSCSNVLRAACCNCNEGMVGLKQVQINAAQQLYSPLTPVTLRA
jgi:hypothetical protein